jgi:hypothetical protein
MFDLAMQKLRASGGSAGTITVLVVLTLVIIIGGLALMNRDRQLPAPAPQPASQIDTRAYYIAQTALDRSIKALVANPRWREGFDQVPFEDGTYDVEIREADNSAGSLSREGIPPNYLRIVASSEVGGVRKEVEAIWVNTMSAFYNTYSAGDRIELSSHDAASKIVLGNVHNNAWEDGEVSLDAGTTVYGNVTSAGTVDVGTGNGSGSAVVYGDVWGERVNLRSSAEVRKFENLSEWTEGVDLNNDGDTEDMGLSRNPIRVSGTSSVVSRGRSLRDGDADMHIGAGSVRVTVGKRGVGSIPDPRPNFTAYYELVTGLSSYPPASGHVTTPISGDGDGHYFASSEEFIHWLDFQNQAVVSCLRCAGDGRIDPLNETNCPACEGMGRETAIELIGVFYVDDATLDLSNVGKNIVIHGSVVVAKGDPYGWHARSIRTPGGNATIAHFPADGQFVLRGSNRMNFTQTYRSNLEDGSYLWRKKRVFTGEDLQVIGISEPAGANAMRNFPAILAANEIVIEPKGFGFASHPGDPGDERLTVLQGVVYAEKAVRLHARGGWHGEALVFDEDEQRGDGEALDEPVLNIDLNGDGDAFDRVELSSVTTVPVIPMSDGKYSVDINNDGMLSDVTLGTDYVGFFNDNGYICPILIYQEGLVLGQYVHSCDQTLVVFDPLIAAAGIPFGFETSYGSATYPGLVSWSENGAP